MPRKRKEKPAAKRRQYNLGVSPAVGVRIQHTAETLGLDVTQLLRMIIHEHLPEYEQRAQAIRDAEAKS